MKRIHSICVYCGSSPGSSARYVDAGRALGAAIARAGLRLIYGGGAKGVMGAVATGAMGAGGKVTGIIPRFLMNKEATEDALAQLDELVTTEDMHQRKHIMFEKSDAFVALPGGIGTLEEIVEIMTWAQLGRHSKPIVFANLDGFWDPMLALLEHMRAEGFVHTGDRVRPLVIDRPEEIVSTLIADARPRHDMTGDRQVINRL
ncbi:TIGR00730 family Rossman fold protein [Nitratireductor sp. CAU 1489]|uniref:Cytokinin riboside 5'-monophosphate phosphoribohydrolase n=1 Tax=Nitratireductor arenosus TaxID=2682096 RepID=A0A844QPZ4_9HYPH|nr:TIGR00730 family Rossman fold protein [Nitratireductor arenosus]MVA99649.1 TIGR00730 family Rossman fold protein [Nitratireductor arenosus]